MTVLAGEDVATHTSAAGPMFWAAPVVRAGLIGVLLITSGVCEPATGSTYSGYFPFERTAAGPSGQLDFAPAQTTAEAVLEIRRRSGLTWEELSDLFDVSRRSVHHWASGNVVSAKHERIIRQMLTAIRHLDRGNVAGTRAMLLTTDALGVSALDLLKVGLYEEATQRAEPRTISEQRRMPLSQAAQDARRPPAPRLLLGAAHEPADIPAKARVARAARVPKAS
jgi:transcriptional regulator with XRE-family HTH domain